LVYLFEIKQFFFLENHFQKKIDEAIKPLKTKFDEMTSKLTAPAAPKKEE
jgi:hypothetical protein